jgi:hypothetical protein
MDALLEALRSLSATGAGGFEGFVRDVLAHVTGQKFRLVKPGPQGGIDTLSESSDRDSVSIGVEAKRYGKPKRLPLDELKRKLTDATDTHPDLDLWVLAASQEMCAADQKKLCKVGDRLGVAVLILDWSSSPDALPALAVLAASARRTVEAHIAVIPSIAAELTNIENDERFELERQRLIKQLTAPDLGYATTRRHVAKWLRLSFQDPNTARARLDTFANLHDPAVHLVPRMALEATLSEWWSKSSDAPIALLGDEGAGKTWTILSWWDRAAGEEASGLPLTLVVPARLVKTDDILELIAEALKRQAEGHTSEFWRTRLDRWLRRPIPASPQILLVLDGLNQNWTYADWASLLARLFDEKIRGRVALAMTCRPDHWRTKLKSLQNLRPRSKELTIGPFGDEELDELLSMHGLSRGDFQREMLDLLRIPVLCQRAIQLREELESSGDVTPERLVFEDWRQRLAQHGERLAIDEVEFAEYLTRLGRDLHTQITMDQPEQTLCVSRSEIIKELGRESGRDGEDLATTISEIVDGRWMEQADHPHHFRLRPQRAPFVLGLALVDHLCSYGQTEGLVEQLAAFLDPLRGRDFGVDILRAASTAALLQRRCPSSVRRVLIEAWLSSQNFRRTDFGSFWRLIGADPSLCLRIAEAAWLNYRGGIHADEVLIKGLSNAARWPQVASLLQRWAEKWLGSYWNDPREGNVSGYDPASSGAENRREMSIERRKVWDQELAKRWTGPAVSVECIQNGGSAGWLVHRAIGVLSFLPRERHVPALTAWAITRAIMGDPRHHQEVAWLLRWNPYDPQATEDAVLEAAEALLALNHGLAAWAARFILEALASPRAMEHVAKLPERSRPVSFAPDHLLVNHETGEIDWDSDAAQEAERCGDDILFALRGLSRHAIDPGKSLAGAKILTLRGLASRTASPPVHDHLGTTPADLSLKEARGALARWAPDEYCNLLRSRFDMASSLSPDCVVRIIGEIPEHILLLSSDRIHELKAAFQGARSDLETRVPGMVRPWRRNLLLAQLAGLESRAQINLIRQTGSEDLIAEPLDAVLCQPCAADFSVLSELLRKDQPKERLLAWLSYLCLTSLAEMPSGFGPVFELVGHGDSSVRSQALKVALRSADSELLAAIAAGQWPHGSKPSRAEDLLGSVTLCSAVERGVVSSRSVRERMMPEALGLLAALPGASDEDLNAYSRFVAGEVSEVLHTRTSHVGMDLNLDSDKPLRALVQNRGDEVVSWFEPVLRNEPNSLRHFGFLDDFPVVGLCRALLLERPEEGAQIWSALKKAYDSGSTRRDDFEFLPIIAADCPSVLILRRELLEEANTDRSLHLIALYSTGWRREAWLLSEIRRDLSTPAPAACIARALTLAGSLDSSPEAEALWAEGLSGLHLAGFLAETLIEAAFRYRRNKSAHHWFRCFMNEIRPERALAYFTLFTECADARARIWAEKAVRKDAESFVGSSLLHWQLCWPSLRDQIQSKDRQRKGTLFGKSTLGQTQDPWL